MSVVLLLVALAVLGVLAAVVTGRLDAALPVPTTSSPHRPLPQGPLVADDVDGVRFSLAVRGYRMDEVDAVLARLRAELAARDAGQPVQPVQHGQPVQPAQPVQPVAGPGEQELGPARRPVHDEALTWHTIGAADALGATSGPIDVTGLNTDQLAEVRRRHGRRARTPPEGE